MNAKGVLGRPIWGIGVVMVLLCGGPRAGAQEVQARVGFSAGSVTTVRDIEGERVRIEGCTLRTEAPGEPDLPVRLYRLVIPADLRVTGVRVTQAEFGAVDGRFQIPPTLPPMPLNGGDPVAVESDPAIYGADEPFPAAPVELVGDEFSFGYHLVTVLIHPLRYYPVSGRLEVLTRLEFGVEGEQAEVEHSYALRRSERAAAAVRAAVAALVENGEQLEAFAPPTRIERLGDKRQGATRVTEPWPSLEGLPVDYVMITTDPLAPSFNVLRDWKQAKGLNTVIRTVSDIVAHYPGVDTQERIRNFIIEAGQLWGTPWVLLGGDTNQVPDRKGFDDGYSSRGPTDLYYATAEGTWNANGNTVFGEWEDQVDEGADFFTARAPAENVVEADVFVQKVLRYEQSPPGNFGSRSLLMGATYDCVNSPTYHWAQWCKEDILAIIQGGSDTRFIWRLYNFLTDNQTFWGDELLNHDSAIAHINAGYNFVNHCDHSGVYVMGTGIKCWGGGLDWADAWALTNGPRQGIIFSLGCSPNAFDYDSVSEALMNNPNGGVVAYIGNSRTGYTSQTPQDTSFFQQIFTYGITHLGEAFTNARPACGGGYYIRVLNMLGDPEMRVWTEEPRTVTVDHPFGLYTGTQYVTIAVHDNTTTWPPPPTVGATVCFYKKDDVFEVGTTGPDGTVTMLITCDTVGPLFLTVTAQDRVPSQVMLPVITGPAAHLYVSGFDIDDDQLGQSDGNADGRPDAGEMLELPVRVTNGGSQPESDITVTLTSLTPQVTVLLGDAYIAGIMPGQTLALGPFLLAVDAACPPETVATLQLDMRPLMTPPHVDTFRLTIHAPDLGINGNRIVDDGSGQSHGNGNGRAEAGETVEVYMELVNAGHGNARDVSAVATSNHPHLVVFDGNSAFGDIAAMDNGSALDPILVDISSNFLGDETLTLVVSDYYMERGTFILDLVGPPAPIGLDFDSGADWIYVTWSPVPAGDLLGYHIYRSQSSNGPFIRQDTLIQAGSSLYYDNMLNGSVAAAYYYYYVTAVDESGNESAPSEILLAWITYSELPGWPMRLSGQTLNSAAVANVDGDVHMEIFVGTLDGKVYGFHHDGTKLFPDVASGFAELDPGGSVWGAPSVGDLDRDGSPDVVVTSRGGENKVYAWSVLDANGDGSPDPVPGWPVYMGPGNERSLSAPALADVDGDGWLEVVFTVETGPGGQNPGQVHVIDARGFEEIGWPQGGLGEWTYATPAIGNLVAGRDVPHTGHLEIVAGGANGNIYAWDYQGNLLPGWPVATGDFISSSPALGDIDGDGALEILQNSQNDRLWALEADGTAVAGWEGGRPYPSTDGLMPSPVLADINADNLPEVFLPTNDGVAAWSHDGNPLPGWPVVLASGHGTESSPAVADINGDLAFEVLVGSGDERVHSLNEDGTVTGRWPAHAGERVVAAPTVADIDSDGDMEVIVGAAYTLHIWHCTDPYRIQKIQWGTFHAGTRRTGLYDPVPPVWGTGDSDVDGDVDLADFADFQSCFPGSSGSVSMEPRCWFFDFDRDGIIDLDDYAQFHVRINGPVADVPDGTQ